MYAARYFYPRSPCGERLRGSQLLAPCVKYFYPRSPCGERPRDCPVWSPRRYFYPRSPCGERRFAISAHCFEGRFLSTLSLRRATDVSGVQGYRTLISIHALLAESDTRTWIMHHQPPDFYPRSPCGERRQQPDGTTSTTYFYPRSPCGERPILGLRPQPPERFLSTLSLRRATLYPDSAPTNWAISIHALLAESDR